jgi:hypothetical protein
MLVKGIPGRRMSADFLFEVSDDAHPETHPGVNGSRVHEGFRDALRTRLDQHYADFSRTSEGTEDSEVSAEEKKCRLTSDDAERTTGFEPATLTLAR